MNLEGHNEECFAAQGVTVARCMRASRGGGEEAGAGGHCLQDGDMALLQHVLVVPDQPRHPGTWRMRMR